MHISRRCCSCVATSGPDVKKKRFIAIKQLAAKGLKVSILCVVGEVSRSGYYKYLESIQKQSTDGPLISRIERVQEEVRFSYGAKRMAKYLSIGDESPVNHKRVARLMGENSLNARIRKKIHPEYYYRQKRQGFKITDLRLAPNVLNREFTSSAPVRRLVTDITVINCSDGWLYLSAVMDLYNHEILIHQFSQDVTTSLVVRTICDLASKFEVAGILLHSDKGPTYRSYEYQDLLTSLSITPSFSRTGNCWDNAAMESFFGHLKCELGYATKSEVKPTSRKAKQDITNYLRFFNERRIQKKLGFLSPVQYRERAILQSGSRMAVHQ